MALGDVRPTRTPLQAPNVRTNPDAFGAGVGEAIRGLANQTASFLQSQEGVKDAEAELSSRYDARQRKLKRAKASVEFTRLTNELSRGLTEAAREQERYGEGSA